jgi:hypothetical protein
MVLSVSGRPQGQKLSLTEGGIEIDDGGLREDLFHWTPGVGERWWTGRDLMRGFLLTQGP